MRSSLCVKRTFAIFSKIRDKYTKKLQGFILVVWEYFKAQNSICLCHLNWLQTLLIS